MVFMTTNAHPLTVAPEGLLPLCADMATDLPQAVRLQRLVDHLRARFHCGAVALLQLLAPHANTSASPARHPVRALVLAPTRELVLQVYESVRQYGVLQPIVVRRTMTGYELVAGERRWRASQQAGLKEIPAVVRDYTDGEMTEIALIENLQRENLNPIEEAEAYKRLMEEFGLTQEEVARKIGRSRSLIANTLRLLNLPVGVQQHVSMGLLTTGQIRPILALPTEALQEEAAQTILEQELSARDAEEWVRRLMAGQKERKPRQKDEIVPDVYWQDAEDRPQNRARRP